MAVLLFKKFTSHYLLTRIPRTRLIQKEVRNTSKLMQSTVQSAGLMLNSVNLTEGSRLGKN